MSQLSYFRCASCGEVVSIAFSSYSNDGEAGVQELEAVEKCFSCGYTPFRVRDLTLTSQPSYALADWPE